jgi:hypothetical protein
MTVADDVILTAARLILGARALWVVRSGGSTWVQERGSSGSQWSVVQAAAAPTGFCFVQTK